MGLLKVILGAGESGVGAAILAQYKGFDVFVSDKGKIAPKFKQKLIDHQIPFEENNHDLGIIATAQEIVKSPGISNSTPIMQFIMQQQIPFVGEIEFGWRYCTGKIIAITGSNGKSTTTKLIFQMLKRAHFNVAIGGNIGLSFAELVADVPHDWYVLEISSFQLDDVQMFRPHIAIILNITPDHLDRYAYNFDQYVDSKFKIIANQSASDFFIWCADDEGIKRGLENHIVVAQQYTFTLTNQAAQGAWVELDQINFQFKQNRLTMTINELALQGKHNQYNSMAAGIVGKVLQINKESIRESLMDFEGLEHRLEFVAKVHGIRFINDSKATNVNSTWYALESVSEPIIWIAGGVDKGNDYSHLVGLVKKKVKAIVCLGVDTIKLHDAFSKHVDIIVNSQTMQDAVAMAYRLGKNGDAVLLSPACASFDLFENYEDRGKQFKANVREL